MYIYFIYIPGPVLVSPTHKSSPGNYHHHLHCFCAARNSIGGRRNNVIHTQEKEKNNSLSWHKSISNSNNGPTSSESLPHNNRYRKLPNSLVMNHSLHTSHALTHSQTHFKYLVTFLHSMHFPSGMRCSQDVNFPLNRFGNHKYYCRKKKKQSKRYICKTS